MTESTSREDPRRLEALKLLKGLLEDVKDGTIQTKDFFTKAKLSTQHIGFSDNELLVVLNSFLATEMMSKMDGCYTELPNLNTLPENSWERKRVSSFTWWYVRYVTDEHVASDEPELQLYHPYMSAGFELGKSDEETDKLLKWAQDNTGKVSAMFADSLIDQKDLFHIPLLGKFIQKAINGTLLQLPI